ncbi:Uma2 family endonuclease [soil metagenome]
MATTTERLRLGPADHGRRMTLEEFLEADYVEGYRYELARGVVEVVEIPSDAHGEIVWEVLRSIALYNQEHPGLIQRAGGASEFRIWCPGMESDRHPDIAVVLRYMPINVRGRRPPSMVMEVVSPGAEARRRDYETKREEYLAYGLLEYWIIDPQQRRVMVLLRDGPQWVERVFLEGQEAEGLVLPGFRIAVADLLALGPDDHAAHDQIQEP